MNDDVRALGWWVIHGDDLVEMLQRAANGEDPAMIYLEVYANAFNHEDDDDG